MAVVAEGGGAVTTKLLYILVAEDADLSTPSFRYTRSVLQSTLQLMGCKPRHAFKISQRVFEMMRKESEKSVSACPGVTGDVTKNHLKETRNLADASLKKSHSDNSAIEDDKSKSKPFELYKRRTTVVVGRHLFLDVVCEALSEYKYVGPNQRADLVLACRLRERKESVTVLLCGTSGCGKSTLSALLGSRLGITTVVSTDSIRHMMRSFVDEKQNPLLWASTYHAGEYLDPEAVAEAKAKKKAKKSGVSAASAATSDAVINSTTGKPEGISTNSDLISAKQMAVEGYKAQSEMVIESLDRLITSWEERKESVVVEGVHLSLNFVMGLMKKHPSIVPFMIYIANEEKHLERFAVRAKYMTLDPARNKYVKYIRNIRTIQEYLCNRADKHLVPKINNTNVDRSVAAIHATVFSSLRRREAGEQIYDPVTNTVPIVDEEYRNQCSANSLSSKGVFQMIQRQGSTRHLMALLNSDGSVAKAWPLNAVDYSGNPISGSPPIYGPLRIGKAEPVNLQFGHFGISAWLSDTGCTSHTSSVDESRGEHTDNGSKGFSSSGSSPRLSDGPAKELMEEQSVDGSDEEVDDPPEVDSDEDLSDEEKQHPLQGELEGSVDEESTKSDDEYEDLAMQETPQNGQRTDGGEEYTSKVITGEQTNKNSVGEKNKENLDLLRKTKSETFSDSPLKHKNEKRAWLTGKNMFKRRSQSSIPAVGKHESEIIVPTSKEALSTTSATLLSL